MPSETNIPVHEQNPQSRQQPGRNPAPPDAPRLANERERPASALPDTRSASDSTTRSSDTGRPTPSAGGGGTPDPASSPLAQMHRLIERAGEEPFPDDIIRILAEPIDDSLVDVRPDGLIFVSHPHYRDRLDRAFGVGAWALVPLDKPAVKDNRVVYWGFLKARGQYIGDAVGGAQYYPNNRQGSYDNSVEAAKSDCLVRCCKALPMFRECWDKEYADYWLSQYAEQGVTRTSQGQKVWKKKGVAMRDFTMRPDRQSVGEYSKASRLEDENQRHIDSIEGNKPLLVQDKHDYQENEPGYNEWEEQ